MVAMEYDKGKINARGREISWLNHPCYLGYKGEVGYNEGIIGGKMIKSGIE